MSSRDKTSAIFKPGTTLAIPMKLGGYCFAVVCPGPDCAFFLFRGETEVPPPDLVQKEIAFRVFVAKDAPTVGGWKNVGVATLSGRLTAYQEYLHRPVGAVEIYALCRGERRMIGAMEAASLELAATWFSPHIEERLEDCLKNRPNAYVTAMRRQAGVN